MDQGKVDDQSSHCMQVMPLLYVCCDIRNMKENVSQCDTIFVIWPVKPPYTYISESIICATLFGAHGCF